MKTITLALITVVVAFTASPSLATPPTDPGLAGKADRTIRKAPDLTSKNPLYVLTVFGKEAKHQAWVILDLEKAGRKLTGQIYIDRNGDRDLTAPDEKIALPVTDSSFYRFPKTALTGKGGRETGYTLEIMAANFGRTPETSLHLRIFADTPNGDRFGAWGDQNSDLVLAGSAEKAPVIHFDGPLQMGFEVQQPLGKGSEYWRLCAGVGTYGIGDGTFAYQFYKTIPAGFHPTVVIEWPAASPGERPRKTEFVLKDRC